MKTRKYRFEQELEDDEDIVAVVLAKFEKGRITPRIFVHKGKGGEPVWDRQKPIEQSEAGGLGMVEPVRKAVNESFKLMIEQYSEEEH